MNLFGTKVHRSKLYSGDVEDEDADKRQSALLIHSFTFTKSRTFLDIVKVPSVRRWAFVCKQMVLQLMHCLNHHVLSRLLSLIA